MPVVDSIGRLVGPDHGRRRGWTRCASSRSGTISWHPVSHRMWTPTTRSARPDQSSSAVAAYRHRRRTAQFCDSLSGFEAQLAAVTALAYFPIPLIGGTGGNVGVQASAIVVQGLANGRLDLKEFWHQLWKELRISLLNGVVISVAVFLYTMFTEPGDWALTVAVASSLFPDSGVSPRCSAPWCLSPSRS